MTVVMPALLLFAGVSGALFSFITAYDLPCDNMAVLFCIAIGSVGYTLLYRLKRVGAWVFPVSFGLLLAILALCKDTLVGMAANVWNSVLITLRNANIPNLPQPFRLVESYPSLTLLWAVVVLFLCMTWGTALCAVRCFCLRCWYFSVFGGRSFLWAVSGSMGAAVFAVLPFVPAGGSAGGGPVPGKRAEKTSECPLQPAAGSAGQLGTLPGDDGVPGRQPGGAQPDGLPAPAGV